MSSTTEMFTLPANTASRAGKSIVDEVTTLHHHLEAHHLVSDSLLVPSLLSNLILGKVS
jgi:hypothetical protein